MDNKSARKASKIFSSVLLLCFGGGISYHLVGGGFTTAAAFVSIQPPSTTRASLSSTRHNKKMSMNESSSTSGNRSPRRSNRIRENFICKSSSLDDDNRDSGKSASLKSESSHPRFKVGLIADIQYAPIPDGFSYTGTPRYYQNALHVARLAASKFESDAVDLVVNLG